MDKKNILKRISKILGAAIVLLFALIGLLATLAGAILLRHPVELATAVSAYNVIRDNYYEDVDEAKLLEGLSAGLAESLGDPYSTYYSKEQLAEINNQINGTYAGVGILLGLDKESGIVKALRVFKNSPAEKAGVRAGDILLEVDGTTTEGLNAEQVATKVRGESGSSVAITVWREGNRIDFSLVRAIVNAPSVSGRYLTENSDILYIEIISFSTNTSKELDDFVASLDRKPKGVVLDLRNNGGGLVDQAMKVSRYFVPGGVLFYETGRNQTDPEPFQVSGDRYLNVPVTVLVNENTASASEILAGAMQDYKTGTLVGQNTYGKAVVQSFFPMPTGGALKLTTKRYLTPLKRDLAKTGLPPDVELIPDTESLKKIDSTQMPDEKNDAVLLKALEILRSKGV